MDEVRIELTELGRPYRRINQAFLAFRGSYGASPSSPSPWGRRLIEHRAEQDSLSAFLHEVRDVGSPSEADTLLGP